jgi:hypothetical protein
MIFFSILRTPHKIQALWEAIVSKTTRTTSTPYSAPITTSILPSTRTMAMEYRCSSCHRSAGDSDGDEEKDTAQLLGVVIVISQHFRYCHQIEESHWSFSVESYATVHQKK